MLLFPKNNIVLPPKRTLLVKNKSPKFVEERRVGLETYIRFTLLVVASLLMMQWCGRPAYLTSQVHFIQEHHQGSALALTAVLDGGRV